MISNEKNQKFVGTNWLYARKTRICLHIAIIGELLDFLLKLPKTSFLAVRAHLLTFRKKRKNTTLDFFDEKSKTGLGFEIGQPQQK